MFRFGNVGQTDTGQDDCILPLVRQRHRGREKEIERNACVEKLRDYLLLLQSIIISCLILF